MKEKVSEFFSSGTSIRMSPVQRDYKWDSEKALGLLKSIQKGDAFLAGISYRQEGDCEIISDGCQRITTLTLIAKAYGAFKDFFDDIASGANHFTFVNKRDTEAIIKIIRGEKEFGKLGKSRIVKNYRKILEAYNVDTNRASTLYNLKNSRLFGMELKPTDDEVEIFLALNSKGEAMKPFEMVKSFFSEGGNNFTKYDNISQMFLDKTDKFLKINAGYDKKILRGYTNIIEHYSKCGYDVNKLMNRANSYKAIISNKYYKLIEGKNAPLGVITWIFNIQQSTRSDKNDVVNFVLKWLYFNVPYVASLSNNNNSFQEKETDFISLIDFSETLENIKSKLKSFNRSIPDFEKQLKKGLTYKLSSNYIKSVFDELGYYTALVDCTVEHIYAQNCELGPKDDWHIHCLGNCTLLGQKLNSSVGKKAPVKKFKLPAYIQSGFQPTIDLTSLNQWEDSDIENRHEDYCNRWYQVFISL